MTRDELEKLNYDELKHQFYNKITALKKDYLFYYDTIEKLNKDLLKIVHNQPDGKDMTWGGYISKSEEQTRKEIQNIREQIIISQGMMEATEKTIEKLRAISNLTIWGLRSNGT